MRFKVITRKGKLLPGVHLPLSTRINVYGTTLHPVINITEVLHCIYTTVCNTAITLLLYVVQNMA